MDGNFDERRDRDIEKAQRTAEFRRELRGER